LPDLTDQDLEKIGVASLGHRRLLLRDIAEYNLECKRTVFNVFGWLAEAARG
jgi:hypothetical protein